MVNDGRKNPCYVYESRGIKNVNNKGQRERGSNKDKKEKY